MYNSASLKFTDLPDDILEMVANNLDGFDLIRFGQVNRRIRSITTSLKQEKFSVRSQEDLLNRIEQVIDQVLEKGISVGLICDFPRSPENKFSFQMGPYSRKREDILAKAQDDDFVGASADVKRLRKTLGPSTILRVMDHRSLSEMGDSGTIRLAPGVVIPIHHFMPTFSKSIQINGKRYFREIQGCVDIDAIVSQVDSLLQERFSAVPLNFRGFVRYLGQRFIESANELREDGAALIPIFRREPWIVCSILSILVVAVQIHFFVIPLMTQESTFRQN